MGLIVTHFSLVVVVIGLSVYLDVAYSHELC